MRVSVVMCAVEKERMTQHTAFASCLFLLFLIETEEKRKRKEEN